MEVAEPESQALLVAVPHAEGEALVLPELGPTREGVPAAVPVAIELEAVGVGDSDTEAHAEGRPDGDSRDDALGELLLEREKEGEGVPLLAAEALREEVPHEEPLPLRESLVDEEGDAEGRAVGDAAPEAEALPDAEGPLLGVPSPPPAALPVGEMVTLPEVLGEALELREAAADGELEAQPEAEREGGAEADTVGATEPLGERVGEKDWEGVALLEGVQVPPQLTSHVTHPAAAEVVKPAAYT